MHAHTHRQNNPSPNYRDITRGLSLTFTAVQKITYFTLDTGIWTTWRSLCWEYLSCVIIGVASQSRAKTGTVHPHTHTHTHTHTEREHVCGANRWRLLIQCDHVWLFSLSAFLWMCQRFLFLPPFALFSCQCCCCSPSSARPPTPKLGNNVRANVCKREREREREKR